MWNYIKLKKAEKFKKKKNCIERKLDSKTDVAISLTISFAKENITILLSGYNTARM
jgi:hypothetical protein